MFLNYGKKLVVFAITVTSIFSLSTVKAQQGSDFYLQQIMMNTQAIKGSSSTIQQLTTNIKTTTDSILQKVDTLPTILEKLGQFIDAWLNEDDSDTTANIVPTFTDLGKLLNDNLTKQKSMQNQLNTDLLGDITATTLPSANDLLYSNILIKPPDEKFFFDPDPRKKDGDVNPQYNYIKNASGINIRHTLPGTGWSGTQEDQVRYRTYYNTVMAVASYNGYVLSNQYTDGSQFNNLQQKLIDQASDADKWFAIVASEKIGFVLRQLLIYQSQIFVVLTQLVQTQKQMATAQVMTNALLIAGGMSDESLFLSKAQGVRKL
jgi:hypothetical protein